VRCSLPQRSDDVENASIVRVLQSLDASSLESTKRAQQLVKQTRKDERIEVGTGRAASEV